MSDDYEPGYLLRLGRAIDSVYDRDATSSVCVLWTFDASDPSAIALGEPLVVRGDPSVWEGMAKVSASFDEATVARTYLASPGLQTALRTLDAASPEVARVARSVYPELGFRDMAALNVTDPSGKGCIVSWALAEEGSPIAANTRIRWGRLAAHVAAGMRLRRTQVADPEARLRPDGTVEHAEGGASTDSALATLRDHVARRDRSASATDERQLEAWRGLVAGRWSLIDTFDSDGRRIFLARRNDPREARHAALSQLEINVARLAAMGHSNKLIAYTLGRGESTISTSLSRATSKLGVANRAELVDLVWSFGGIDDAPR